MGRVCVGLLLLLLTACAGPQAFICNDGLRGSPVAELIFGRDIGDRLGVSQIQWQAFLAREVTPRFPDGLTVVDGSGQWRDDARNRIVREPSKVVTIVLPGQSDDQARLDAIVAAYKQRFHQQSVAVIERPGCVGFK